MKDEIKINKIKTMSSVEIAELAGKEHRNVIRDIQMQLGKLEGGVLRFEQTYTHPQNGQVYKMYSLPKRETLILVSGYSVELRAKIIDRWDQLEQEYRAANNEDSRTILVAKALIAASQMLEEKDAKIKELEPKAAFADHIAESPKYYSFREAAKLMGLQDMGEKNLFAFARKQRLLMPNNEPYQTFVASGIFKTVAQKFEKPNGEKAVNVKTVITGKGLDYISKILKSYGYQQVKEFRREEEQLLKV